MSVEISAHPDILFINPEQEGLFLGKETGVISENGHTYRLIDGKIAVKELSVINRIAKDSFIHLTLSFFGVFSGSFARGMGVSMRNYALEVSGGALFQVSVVCMAIIQALRMQYQEFKIMPPIIFPSEIIEIRQEVKEKGIIAYCEKEKFHDFKMTSLAFTSSEFKRLIRIDAENYTTEELFEKLATEVMSENLTDDFWDKKFQPA